ncbi:type 1 fimbrial protein [Pseudomonas paralactis]|uniref:Type 1 fimbrial protein n=1 Tax=Pseudomonas paralactis TaxID=1615673 RepID=A0ABS0V3M5_9PSED|nr:type 1 fimbrial protein [Pseudomonas paralactis]MBI6634899.1 type 1 fimbrial protein [Pseudomonas paralactis]
MNVRRVSVMTGLLCLWASACGAAETAGQGTIRFSGAIVESGCATNAHSGSVMELRGCANVSRGSRFEVRNVAPVASVNAAHVRLVADSGEGRYYDQRYLLVDTAGKPIQSGNYIITMTSP